MSSFNSILFEVVRQGDSVPRKDVTLYANHIEKPASIVVPYQSLIDTFKFLYGNDIVCHFRLKTIDYKNK